MHFIKQYFKKIRKNMKNIIIITSNIASIRKVRGKLV